MSDPAPQTSQEHTRLLRLKSIVRDPTVQIRTKGLNPHVVERYRTAVRNAGASQRPLPPVIVAEVGDTLWLVDGFHRTKAHELEGSPSIEAVVVPCSSIAEAKWQAAERNLSHGLPISRADRRTAFKRFIAAKGHLRAPSDVSKQRKSGRPSPNTMTLGEVAAVIGVSKSCARNWFRSDAPNVYEELYAQEEPRSGGEHLEPYSPYRGDSELDLARTSFINIGAALEALPRGEPLNEFVAALSQLLQRLQELHGKSAIQEALLAGWQEGWFHRPAEVSDF